MLAILNLPKKIQYFSKGNTLQIYPPTLKKILSFKRKKYSKYFNIIWVGRLDREKGIEEFSKLICKIDFKSKIFILGGGKMKQHYKNFVEKIKTQKLKYISKGIVINQTFITKNHIY